MAADMLNRMDKEVERIKLISYIKFVYWGVGIGRTIG